MSTLSPTTSYQATGTVRFGLNSPTRIEIYYEGEWGTVCDDQFDDIDATVFCRSMGCTSGTRVTASSTADGTLPILADDMACTLEDTDFLLCSGRFGSHNCGHSEDVGATCVCPGGTLPPTLPPTTPPPTTPSPTTPSPTTPSPTTLPPTPIPTTMVRFGEDGQRAEVYYEGQWGTVCDDSFDDIDAVVFCRTLGYTDGCGTMVRSTSTADGTLPILADNMACTLDDTDFLLCSGSFGSHNCGHSEDVGVTCGVCPPVPGPTPSPTTRSPTPSPSMSLSPTPNNTVDCYNGGTLPNGQACNDNGRCPTMASNGDCKTFPNYMEECCKQSCSRWCPDVPTPAPSNSPTSPTNSPTVSKFQKFPWTMTPTISEFGSDADAKQISFSLFAILFGIFYLGC